MNDFNSGFEEMMSSAIEYERLKRAGKKVPKRFKEKLNSSMEWLNGFSDEYYFKLIH